MKKTLCGAFAALLLAGCASFRTTDDIPVVKNFDAARYMGVWHEIARLPNGYQRDMTNVSAEYKLDGDTLRVTNYGWREGKMRIWAGVGRFAGAKDEGALCISLYPPFYDDYRIIWLSPEYDLSLVTSGDRSCLWMYSRDRKVDAARRDALVKTAQELGFETSKLQFSE